MRGLGAANLALFLEAHQFERLFGILQYFHIGLLSSTLSSLLVASDATTIYNLNFDLFLNQAPREHC